MNNKISNPQDAQEQDSIYLNNLIRLSVLRRLSTHSLETQRSVLEYHEQEQNIDADSFGTPQNEPLDFDLLSINLDLIDGTTRNNNLNPQDTNQNRRTTF